MLSDMASNPSEPASGSPSKPAFRKVGENLYRFETTGGYYALLKRGDKQFRRSLKTGDRKLAERRLAQLRKDVGNLTISADANLPFRQIAARWLAPRPSSASAAC